MNFSKLVTGFKKRVRKILGRFGKRVPQRNRRKGLSSAAPSAPLLELENLPAELPAPQRAIYPWQGPQVLKSFEEFSLVQLSAHTQKAYQGDLKDFLVFLRSRGFEGPDVLARVTPIDVAQFRGFLINERKLGRNSVTRKIAVLKSFYKWALAQGWAERNPAELVKAFPQSQDSKTGFLNDEEVDRLLLHVSERRPERLIEHLQSVVLETLLLLGLRRSEACSIRLGHLELSDQQWLLRVQGKGERERLLPLPPRLLARWMEWLRRIVPGEELPLPGEGVALNLCEALWMEFFRKHADQPLLVSTRAKTFDRALSSSEVGHLVRRSSRKAGIPIRVSPHMLRATAITHALDAGASHRGVQQMAGWTSPLMITRYDKRRNDPKFSAIYHLRYARWPDALTKRSSDVKNETAPQVHSREGTLSADS